MTSTLDNVAVLDSRSKLILVAACDSYWSHGRPVSTDLSIFQRLVHATTAGPSILLRHLRRVYLFSHDGRVVRAEYLNLLARPRRSQVHRRASTSATSYRSTGRFDLGVEAVQRARCWMSCMRGLCTCATASGTTSACAVLTLRQKKVPQQPTTP